MTSFSIYRVRFIQSQRYAICAPACNFDPLLGVIGVQF
jgi:hypothetical protein